MNKSFAFAGRNIKEMLREPLSLVFCLGFPVVMLLLMQLIFTNMDFVPENFKIKNYASGVCVFGFTFTSLFVALQIASDKNTSFIKRINIAPTSKLTYYASFFISALPVAVTQTILFFLIALAFGFPFDGNFVLSILYLIPSAALYICIGIMIGVLSTNEKQTGPISSIFISIVGIFGGVFMPLSVFGGGFATFINILPFGHSVQIASELQSAGALCIYPHVLILLGYIIALIAVVAVVEKLRSKKR